jgi:hypothetical protein
MYFSWWRRKIPQKSQIINVKIIIINIYIYLTNGLESSLCAKD